MTRIAATIEFDSDELPEELQDVPIYAWGAGELGLLLQDGDGGLAMAYGVRELPEEPTDE